MKLKLILSILIMSCFFLVSSVFSQESTAEPCDGAPLAQLLIGQQGQVTPGAPNNVRDMPDTDGTKIGEIPGGANFSVLDGPVCADGFNWWFVAYEDIEGWTVEGSGEDYFVIPIAPPPTFEPIELIELHQFQIDNTGSVQDILYSPDNRYIAIVTFTARLIIIDAETYETVLDINYADESNPERQLRGLAWSPDSDRLAFSLSDNSQARIISVPDGELLLQITDMHIYEYSGNLALPVGLAFTADGSRLVSYGADGFVRLWSTSNGRVQTTFYQAPYSPDARDFTFIGGGDFAISPDRSEVTYIFRNGLIYRVSLETNQPLPSPPAYHIEDRQPMTVNYSQDGETIVYVGLYGGIQTYHIPTGDSQILPVDSSSDVAIAIDGLLVNGNNFNEVEFYDLATLGTYNTISSDVGNVIEFNAEGNILIAGGSRGMIRVWEVIRPDTSVEG